MSTIRHVVEASLARVGNLPIRAGLRLKEWQIAIVEAYLKRQYLKQVLDEYAINCVLDVGAQRGSTVELLRRLGYAGRIVSFEPNEGDFAILSEQFGSDSRWRGLNVALGSEAARRPFNVTANTLHSSFLLPLRSSITETYEVEIRRLDDVWESLVGDLEEPRVFLKVDTQGFDLEVVRGAERSIRDVAVLQSEVSVQPIYDGMPHYLESLEYYESLGFQLLDLFRVLRDKRRHNIIEYDCLFARLDLRTA